ncbi:MAG: GspH/FimT family pseudopilin [Pseudomonadota bacterium]
MTEPARPASDAGLSLVETLVAVSIIALMAVAIMLAIPSWPSAQEAEAERMLARFDHARERALVTGQLIGFLPDADGRGYGFLSYDGQAWRLMTDDPALRARTLQDGVSVFREDAVQLRQSAFDTGVRPLQPEIWFDPTGLDEAFVYVVEGDGGSHRVVRAPHGALRIEDVR